MPISELLHRNPHGKTLFVSRCGLSATGHLFDPAKIATEAPLTVWADTQANQEFCDFGRLAPAQRGTCGGEQQNVAAQYSSANMMVMTRSVTDGSAGSGE